MPNYQNVLHSKFQVCSSKVGIQASHDLQRIQKAQLDVFVLRTKTCWLHFLSWWFIFRMRLLLASTIPCTQSFLQLTSTLTPIVTKLATWHSWFSANTRFPALAAAAAQSVFTFPSLLGLCFNSYSSNCSLNEELSWWCHHRSSTTSTTSTHEGWW